MISTYIYVVTALMGVNFKEETTAGLLAFCALEGVGSGPVGGEYKKKHFINLAYHCHFKLTFDQRLVFSFLINF